MRVDKDGVEYGYDDTVPFNPVRSETFLTGEAQQKAVAVLDEFLAGHGERLVQDPVKRAVLQHDLWAAFDNELHAYPGGKKETISDVENDRRAKLFREESGGLHPLGKDEKEPNLLGMGIGDMTVNDCMMCHSGSGIFSVQSYTRGLAASVENPQLPPTSYPSASLNQQVGYWKMRQFDWGLLKGLLDH